MKLIHLGLIKKIYSYLNIILIVYIIIPSGHANAQEARKLNPALEQGIGQYKHENYDEALPLLEQAVKEEPKSTLAAYYLGLNYKQLQNYRKAIVHLRNAVTYTPKIKGALIELIDSLYQYDELEEAEKWIVEAESEGIRPAQIAFLKGLVLIKKEEYALAIESFQKAKSLDKSMEQASDFQIGIAHLKAKEIDAAKDAFSGVIDIKPSSNLAEYADQYIDAITKSKEALKPWKISYSTAWQYDDNVVLKPGDAAVATNITNEGDARMTYDLRTEYNHRFNERYGIKGAYNFYFAKQSDLGFYDTMVHAVNVEPRIYNEKSLLAFPTAYNYNIVDDRTYLVNPSTGVLYNHTVGENQMAQTYLLYNYKDFRFSPLTPDEDRDGNGTDSGLGWYWFFAKRKGFFNVRYGYNYDWTEGNNWEFSGNRFNTTLLAPVTEKVDVSLAGSVYLQNYANTHTVFGVEREDETYSASSLLTYKFCKYSEFQLQYTHVRDDSNLAIYDYKRNIYSAGVVLKF